MHAERCSQSTFHREAPGTENKMLYLIQACSSEQAFFCCAVYEYESFTILSGFIEQNIFYQGAVFINIQILLGQTFNQ
jgi:hypothetical protein